MDTVLRKKVSEIKTKRILLKQMHCIDVLDHMDCIYIAKKQRLKQVDHNDGQIRSNSEFLDIAPTYAGWAKQFLDALYETNQKYLADMLLPLEGYSPPISDNDLTPDEPPDPPNFPQNRSEAPPSYENTFPNMVANPNHRSYNSDQGEEMKNLQRKLKSNQLGQNLTESEAVPISEQSNADQMRLDSCSQSDNQTNETLSAFNFPNTTSFNNASRDTSTSFNNASRDTDSKSSYKAKNLNAVQTIPEDVDNGGRSHSSKINNFQTLSSGDSTSFHGIYRREIEPASNLKLAAPISSDSHNQTSDYTLSDNHCFSKNEKVVNRTVLSSIAENTVLLNTKLDEKELLPFAPFKNPQETATESIPFKTISQSFEVEENSVSEEVITSKDLRFSSEYSDSTSQDSNTSSSSSSWGRQDTSDTEIKEVVNKGESISHIPSPNSEVIQNSGGSKVTKETSNPQNLIALEEETNKSEIIVADNKELSPNPNSQIKCRENSTQNTENVAKNSYDPVITNANPHSDVTIAHNSDTSLRDISQESSIYNTANNYAQVQHDHHNISPTEEPSMYYSTNWQERAKKASPVSIMAAKFPKNLNKK